MRKVRITLKEGSPGRKFFLFPSAEALYVWVAALEKNEQVQVEGMNELLLEPGSFIEAELRGFEYAYDGSNHKRLDLVRMGKAQQTKNASGLQASIYTGWVTGNLLPMKKYADADIDVQPIDGGQLDLSRLFNDVAGDD